MSEQHGHSTMESLVAAEGAVNKETAGPGEARLIAAAPDLLAACKMFIEEWIAMDEGEARAMDMARAAVLKAEGK